MKRKAISERNYYLNKLMFINNQVGLCYLSGQWLQDVYIYIFRFYQAMYLKQDQFLYVSYSPIKKCFKESKFVLKGKTYGL